MNKKDYIIQLVSQGYQKEDIKILVDYKFPAVAAAPADLITIQESLDRTIDLIVSVYEKASRHGVMNITDLTTGDAIYNFVEQGKIYFMAVDHAKQYLMQGLCISKNATQATFVGYSWNTSVKHTNTVWGNADKGKMSGDILSFNGVDVNGLKNDDNALANVALVKSLVSSAGSGESWKDITSNYKTRTWTMSDIGKNVRLSITLQDGAGSKKIIASTISGDVNNSGILTDAYISHVDASILTDFSFGFVTYLSFYSNLEDAVFWQKHIDGNSSSEAKGKFVITKFEIKE